mgnify:FL=1
MLRTRMRIALITGFQAKEADYENDVTLEVIYREMLNMHNVKPLYVYVYRDKD